MPSASNGGGVSGTPSVPDPASVEWLRIQLDCIIEDAEALFRSIGSGTELSGAEGQSARALLANLRDARKVLR